MGIIYYIGGVLMKSSESIVKKRIGDEIRLDLIKGINNDFKNISDDISNSIYNQIFKFDKSNRRKKASRKRTFIEYSMIKWG